MCLVFLCGNHIRGLPIDEFNRAFDLWLREELGEAFKEAAALSGSRSKLEASGTAFLRSFCKLAFDGHGCYEKGDGKEVKLWLLEHYPNPEPCACLGR